MVADKIIRDKDAVIQNLALILWDFPIVIRNLKGLIRDKGKVAIKVVFSYQLLPSHLLLIDGANSASAENGISLIKMAMENDRCKILDTKKAAAVGTLEDEEAVTVALLELADHLEGLPHGKGEATLDHEDKSFFEISAQKYKARNKLRELKKMRQYCQKDHRGSAQEVRSIGKMRRQNHELKTAVRLSRAPRLPRIQPRLRIMAAMVEIGDCSEAARETEEVDTPEVEEHPPAGKLKPSRSKAQ
eukprot:s1650_g9.t1